MGKSTSVRCWCGVIVNRKADLPRHQRTHASNKEELMHHCPYDSCRFKTLQRSNLRTHIHIHTGERPHKCPDCPFAAKDPSSLIRHRNNRHLNEPKGRSSFTPASVTNRNANRARRRCTPYPTSSSVSPPETSTSSSSPSLACDHIEEENKNKSATYSPESITELVHVDDAYAMPNSSLPRADLDSGLLTAPEIPSSTYSSIYASYPTIQPVCDMTVTEEIFNNFLSKYGYGELSPEFTSLSAPYNAPTTFPQPVYDTATPAPTDLLSHQDEYIVGTFIPALTPAPTPFYEVHPASHEYHGYIPEAASSHAQSSQPRFFAPDMGAYLSFQSINHLKDNVYSTMAGGFASPEL